LVAFIKASASRVLDSNNTVIGKGTSIKMSSDYCSQIVTALRTYPELKQFSDVEVKLALPEIAKAHIFNGFASMLGVIPNP